MSHSIEIVTHCYAGHLPQYATLLKLQLASLFVYQPHVRMRITVCFAPGDKLTEQVLQCHNPKIDVEQLLLPLEPALLFRRAIGRNIRAKLTDADVIWFTDCDYFFGEGCIDSVAAQVPVTGKLFCPRGYWIHRDHATGDAAIERATHGRLAVIDPAEFEFRDKTPAIGGLQIVGGDTARRVGYCDGTDWVKPVDPAKGFRSCKCDVAFRRLNGFSATFIDVPNLYRVRHSDNGRDYTLAGEKAGKRAWK